MEDSFGRTKDKLWMIPWGSRMSYEGNKILEKVL